MWEKRSGLETRLKPCHMYFKDICSLLIPFPRGDVSGKVWPTLISTQQAGIYPKSSLGFAIYLVRLYDVSGHRRVQRVKAMLTYVRWLTISTE